MSALSDIAEVNPRLSTRLSDDDFVSFLGMADVSEFGKTTPGLERPYSEVKKGFTPFLNGDLLIAKITPCFENGKIAQARLRHSQGFGSTEFHVVRVDGKLAEPRYVLHMLRSPDVRRAGEMRMTGSAGQKRVPREFIEKLEIPLPPLHEQRRIAKILDHADAVRDTSLRVGQLIEEFEESLFVEAFGDLVANERGWPIVSVSDFVARFSSGKSIVGVEDTHAISRPRVLKISAVTSGRFRGTESKPLPEGYKPPVSHLISQGDLLFSRANTRELVGATAYVDVAPRELALPDKLWRFEWPVYPRAHPVFVWKMFSRPEIRAAISGVATGSGGSMKNVAQSSVLGLRFALPGLDDQQQFVGAIAQAERFLTLVKRRQAVLDELFTSLQTRAFEGTL